MSPLRSDLLQRVLGCLRDHPHDDTVSAVARLLGLSGTDAPLAALTALEEEGLVMRAGTHWSLTRAGWRVARIHDPLGDAD